ncbi:MAG TPA: apolipoprotein N-acyltransferase [Acidobacteriaceae bacterium]|nr:apolipoprotein N-acyltransferase [Acidobacteriaceae bacterium]
MVHSASMPPSPNRTQEQPVSFAHLAVFALLSAVLLNLPFPIAGPLPPWRAIIGWFALTPLLFALLAPRSVAAKHYLRHSALTAYLCGIVWYVLNCYWIYNTMTDYAAGVSPAGGVGILMLFSAVLGLYFALFGFLIAYLRRKSGGILVPLALAPFIWTALELLAARFTSVPWDQLGYSQVDNLLLTRLAPITGTYGISFVLIAVNALLAAALLAKSIHTRLRIGTGAVLLIALLQLGSFTTARPSPTSAYAVLLQPNLNVGRSNNWFGPVWDQHVAWIIQQGRRTCTPAYPGMPGSSVPLKPAECALNTPPPGVVIWPEAQSPLLSDDPRTIALLHTLATTTHAPVIAGMLGQDRTGTYNSAVFTAPDGKILGRYDKIHLVPFGEYIPYRNLFFFAHQLTQQLVDLQRGKVRRAFRSDGHSFGIFICYESIFANEIRQFALNGAQVFVNISDDGWYGNTSAPWQHLNMARMRAIENHRWILLDTNNGITTVIDPKGRVTWSAPRNTATSLVARYGYEHDLTFYTRFGDVFAWLCGIISLGALLVFARRRRSV